MCMAAAVSGWASRPEPSPLARGVRSVRMLHIPKTAGMSLINQLKRERVDVPNMEWCFNRFAKLPGMRSRSERAKVFALTFVLFFVHFCFYLFMLLNTHVLDKRATLSEQ